jgi:2,4-dienoyl-CoA reductase-like NADH-dependent reductase (Old Yellow Enzyme family)
MAFDGEAFVEEMRHDLIASGRTLADSNWVKRVEQGEAAPQELVGWARQH